MVEDVYECRLYFRVYIATDVLKQCWERKNIFDFFGTDIVPIESEISEKVDLSSKHSTFSWMSLDELNQLKTDSSYCNLENISSGRNRQN